MDADRERLVISHLRLVDRCLEVKRRSAPLSVPYEELKSAAYLGLVTAASRFDPGRGAAFSSFAWRYIQGAMSEYLRRADWVTRTQRRKEREAGLPREQLCPLTDEPVDAESLVEEAVIRADEIHRLIDLVAALPDREREIIVSVYWDGSLLAPIAERMGVTESRVSQIRKEALARLRQGIDPAAA